MIDKRFSLVDNQVVKPIFALLLFCGLALILSIPAGREVKDLAPLAALRREGMYFYVYIFLSGILGLSLGTLAALQRERGIVLYIHIASRVGIGNAMLVPYFIFARSLYPGRESMLVLMILYGTLVSLFTSVISRLVEERGHGASPRGFLAKYAVFAVYYVLPLVGIPVLSPLGFVNRLFAGASVWRILLGFVAPLVLTLGGVILCERRLGRQK